MKKIERELADNLLSVEGQNHSRYAFSSKTNTHILASHILNKRKEGEWNEWDSSFYDSQN